MNNRGGVRGRGRVVDVVRGRDVELPITSDSFWEVVTFALRK